MVLKRLFVTALGALGLGALATGPASAQQVPAPDFFNDQVVCSTANAAAMVPDPLAPTGANMMGPSLLDQALRGADGESAHQVVDATSDAGMSLNFVINPEQANCGRGDGTAFMADDANYQLAQGYTEVLNQFMIVVREEGEVMAAQRALNMAIENGLTGSALEDVQDDLDDARDDLAEETGILNSLGAGPIYQAGIAEWRAKGRVDSAIEDWDEAVPMVTTTRTSLREASYANYVVLPGQSLLDGLTNTDGDLLRSAIAAYIGETSDGATTGFDEDGALILPMTGTGADAVVTETATAVSAIMDNSAKVDEVVGALEEAIADTADQNQARRLGEALRRARLEKAHLNSYLRRALNDNTELDGSADQTADDYELDSIRVRNAAYGKAVRDRDDAEDDLRSAVATRHMATETVQDAFQGPGSYYEQYVARHNYLTGQARKVVADAIDAGVTPTKSLTDAVADAQEALDDAVEARDRYQTMVADTDNPAANLIHDLLVPDGEKTDDDGQAVVDAVSDTYGVAKDARDTANRVADEVSGLTGEGGQVAMNADNISDNSDAIAQNENDIEMNRGMIMTNADGIATNAGNIASNTGHIMENRGMIETNTAGIMMNAGAISENRGMIETNAAGVASNADAIAANMNSIGSNSSAISDNRNMIGELSDDLDVVRAGVAASMALAGMPAINGRGISIGVGSFDGESAFAVGFQVQGETTSFKVGVTSSGGATGASAGVGFQF